MGWILINFEGQYFQILVGILQPLVLFLLQMIIYTLPVILCGLMLGIASGVGRHAFLQIGLWAAAGGILGHLVTIPVRMVNTAIFAKAATLPQWESDLVGILALLAVMCTYGFSMVPDWASRLAAGKAARSLQELVWLPMQLASWLDFSLPRVWPAGCTWARAFNHRI